MKKIEQGKTILTCHDEDCPKCGFPETLDVRDEKTMEIKRRICSKRCGWEISIKELKVLNNKTRVLHTIDPRY